ncbi:helix-turn-helix domain-containing protein [Streptomyces griseosporeus]|uniref:helix-turn-helix domain-containing protein n=1 Tax=Streptomyces griseosporeus TaxID=1910 RepID=UPI00368A695C
MTAPPPQAGRLASALRELRTRTGLSMAALAAKTTYSKSSWERYLNGKSLPPREAVQDLCRLAGEPEGHCLALWEIAESAWSGRAAGATAPTSAPEDPPDRRDRHPALVALLITVCAVTVAGVAAGLLLLPGHPAPHAAATPTGPRCQGTTCDGKDPITMLCAAAPLTLATHHTTSGAWLELRYSRPCGTAWARMWATRTGDRLEVTTTGHTETARVPNARATTSYIYTPMTTTGRGTPVRACFHPAGGGGEECFDGRVR